MDLLCSCFPFSFRVWRTPFLSLVYRPSTSSPSRKAFDYKLHLKKDWSRRFRVLRCLNMWAKGECVFGKAVICKSSSKDSSARNNKKRKRQRRTLEEAGPPQKGRRHRKGQCRPSAPKRGWPFFRPTPNPHRHQRQTGQMTIGTSIGPPRLPRHPPTTTPRPSTIHHAPSLFLHSGFSAIDGSSVVRVEDEPRRLISLD